MSLPKEFRRRTGLSCVCQVRRGDVGNFAPNPEYVRWLETRLQSVESRPTVRRGAPVQQAKGANFCDGCLVEPCDRRGQVGLCTGRRR
jgi:hypothetical protein